jgi:hypothetical protein
MTRKRQVDPTHVDPTHVDPTRIVTSGVRRQLKDDVDHEPVFVYWDDRRIVISKRLSWSNGPCGLVATDPGLVSPENIVWQCERSELSELPPAWRDRFSKLIGIVHKQSTRAMRSDMVVRAEQKGRDAAVEAKKQKAAERHEEYALHLQEADGKVVAVSEELKLRNEKVKGASERTLYRVKKAKAKKRAAP